MNLENIKIIDLALLSVDDLKNEQTIDSIEELGGDDQFETEPMAAREFYEALEAVLNKYGGQINGTDVYQRLFRIKAKLFWQGLQAMEKKLKQQSLLENVLFALKNNIDVGSYISSYLNLFEYGVGPDHEERQMFLYGLVRNEEMIGDQSLTLKTGENTRSTIANWVKDYLGYIDPKSVSGESYEMTQYMYSSPNVKAINSDEKQVLSNVLGIYNLLRNPKYIPEIIKEEEQVRSVVLTLPQAPTSQPVERTAFEKKLEAISVAPKVEAHGIDLEVLKQRVEAAAVAAPLASVTRVNQSDVMKEIRREVATPELPAHEIPKPTPLIPKPVMTVPKPVIPAARPIPPPPAPKISIETPPTTRPASTFAANFGDVKNIDDLKRIGIDHLRRGPLDAQMEQLKTKIVDLARADRVIPDYALSAFEESPLFRLYLAHGNAIFSGLEASGELNKDEFEAIADLRKEIQRSN